MTPSRIVLDDGAGNVAVVAPRHGAWLLRYVRHLRGHGPIDVLHVASAEAGDTAPFLAGCHVMFPAAGPSRSGDKVDAYRWCGEVRPMPLHGFAHRLPWRVAEVSATVVRLILEPGEATRDSFPFAFRLRLSYALIDGALRTVLEIDNRGDVPMPFSTGFHPFLRLPLTPLGRRDRCFVRLPACRAYVAGPEGIEGETRRAPRHLSAAAPAAPAIHFADLETVHAEALDEDSGLRLTIDAQLGSAFRCLTLWSPQVDAPYFCIEPRTAIQDAFTYGRDQLTLLAPGTSFTASMTLDLQEGRSTTR